MGEPPPPELWGKAGCLLDLIPSPATISFCTSQLAINTRRRPSYSPWALWRDRSAARCAGGLASRGPKCSRLHPKFLVDQLSALLSTPRR